MVYHKYSPFSWRKLNNALKQREVRSWQSVTDWIEKLNLQGFLISSPWYNLRHNRLISFKGLEWLVASKLEWKRHVAEVAEWRKVSATSATSAMLRIKNGALIFREKGCWKQFLRTFEEVREYVRGKSVGLRWWGYQVIRWIRIIEWKRIGYAELLFVLKEKICIRCLFLKLVDSFLIIFLH